MASPMTTCPACATPVDQTHRYCPACGSGLDLSESPTGTAPRRSSASDGSAAPRAASTPRPSGTAGPAGARPDERFAPGTVLGERYRIHGLLGRGGMGEVYRADDLKLDQAVALKFLPRALEGDADRLDRLYAEVRIARQVSHPAVCRVWDIAEAEGQHFLSMEFVDGENLSSLLRRIGRFPADKALDVARQLCAGLAAAHERGVLHRDLKPANVMIDGQGKVRITDFGLAGLADSFRDDDVRSGTPSYMSPEQLLGREVTVRSDVYALGLVLYELFTGRRAFEGKTVAELVRKHRDESPADPSALVPDLAPAVERTILACLEKDPRRRPPSALVAGAMLTGRDPLEAAIAAGETPSPELVAAAGESEGLRPRVAVACLAVVAAGILAVPLLQQPLHLYSQVPVEKSPPVLEDRARELLATIGQADAPVADSEVGLDVDQEYFREVLRRDRSAHRWDGLRTGEPPVARFWYRQSPRPLQALRSLGRVTPSEPPEDVSGMAGVSLDMTGRLLSLYVVPPQVEDETTHPARSDVDWAPVFEAARLDPSRLEAVTPRWMPPFETDRRFAWEGSWPERPDIHFRVEAAAYRGRPAWFQIVHDWTRPVRMEPFPFTRGQRVAQAIVILLALALTATGGVLARRNLRLGRGDRRGAFRLALAITGLGMAAWTLAAHHVADPVQELILIARGASVTVLIAALLWLFYLALEPYVRRLRPWTLISWTRLLAGGFGDAVVGRDALIGMVWGAGLGALLLVAEWVPLWLGGPAPLPEGGHLDALLGLRGVLHLLLGLPVDCTLLGLGALLLFLVLRLLTRRDTLAAALIVVVLTANSVGSSEESWWLTLSVGVLVFVTYVVLLLRFGVLSAIVGPFTLDLLLLAPESYDLGHWTGGATLVVVPALLVLAGLAFHVAVGGHSGLRPHTVADASSSWPA